MILGVLRLIAFFIRKDLKGNATSFNNISRVSKGKDSIVINYIQCKCYGFKRLFKPTT